jgi:hypothetical protein
MVNFIKGLKVINSFKGENRWLSNFHLADVEYEGIIYPSTEHAYQAAKTLDQEERLRISKLPKPGDSKRAGNKVKLREDWESIKLQVMEDLVRQKFTKHHELKLQLASTYNEELIEGNTWNDTYWGVCNGKGENHLGKILMKVRKEIIKDIGKVLAKPLL